MDGGGGGVGGVGDGDEEALHSPQSSMSVTSAAIAGYGAGSSLSGEYSSTDTATTTLRHSRMLNCTTEVANCPTTCLCNTLKALMSSSWESPRLRAAMI